MYNDTFTATAQVRRHTFRLERDFKILVLKRISTLSVAAALLTGCPERVSCVMLDHAGNRTDNVNRVQLGAMSFFKQMGEGAINEVKDAVTGLYTVSLPMVLTADKGIHITSEDTVSFELDDAVVGAIYELHLYESPFYGSNLLEYTAVTNLSGSKRKSLDVDNLAALIIPVSSGINRIIVKYAHGGTAETSIAELLEKNSQINDIETRQKTINLDGEFKVGGSARKVDVFGSEESQYVLLDTGDIVHVDFDSEGDTFEVTQIGIRPRTT
jgi:hypothetical protein